MTMFEKYMDIAPQVKAALDAGQPVVALESTIISHGMPYPANVETALECERIVCENGAVPATLAIIGGKMKVGLDRESIEYLAKAKGIEKVSRRDIPFAISAGKDGALTVAATMITAALAGIRVIATGGIGGVHRGAPQTFDISADLQELSRTSVCVVCAGVKSILDIGLTLEYLETQGVPVVGMGTDDFPAFYTPRSGFKISMAAKDEEEIARLLKAKWDTGLMGGVVVGNPIPEEYGMDETVIQQAINRALSEAEEKNIRGKALTPFLLDRIRQLTNGESLQSNIQLVCNNARVAALIAVRYALLHIDP